jgi:hypothetical protein
MRILYHSSPGKNLEIYFLIFDQGAIPELFTAHSFTSDQYIKELVNISTGNQ